MSCATWSQGRVRGVGRPAVAPPLLLVVGVLTALSVSGCGRVESPASDTSVVLSIGFPIPKTATGEAEGVRGLVSYLSQEGLLHTRMDGRYAHQLAERHDVSHDGLAVTFDLRRDVTFHDGTELTAEIVKASLDRSRNDPAQLAFYPMLGEIKRYRCGQGHTAL